MQVSFNTRKIHPSSYTNKDGLTNFNTTVLSPTRYNLSFGEGLMPVDQMRAIMEKCAEESIEVEIEFMEISKTYQGTTTKSFEIYSVKPIQKPIPTSPKVS